MTLQYYLTSNIVTGQKYRFRVMAFNAIGYSSPSSYLEMMPATTPGSPETPTLTALSSSSIQISWTFDESKNGGTPVTDFTVYWDNGINGNVEVAAASTGLWGTFTTVADSVTAGVTYNFWVTATNYIGVGTASNKLQVTASQVPDAPDIPVATATYNSIQITWQAPNNQGSPVTYYTVFLDSDGNDSDDYS